MESINFIDEIRLISKEIYYCFDVEKKLKEILDLAYLKTKSHHEYLKILCMTIFSRAIRNHKDASVSFILHNDEIEVIVNYLVKLGFTGFRINLEAYKLSDAKKFVIFDINWVEGYSHKYNDWG